MKLSQTQLIIVIAIVAIGVYIIWKIYNNKPMRFWDNFFCEGSVCFDTKEPNKLSVGDMVKITQDPGAKYQEYDGQHKVTRVGMIAPTDYSANNFQIDMEFRGNTPANPGTVQKSNF